jgi:GPI mannosyltransferase 1 subunit M
VTIYNLSLEVVMSSHVVIEHRHHMHDPMSDHVAHQLKRLFSSFPFVLFLSVIARVTLILYSEWHDAHSVVKYTDVDYRVFSDAAQFVLGRSYSTSVSAGPLAKRISSYYNIGRSGYFFFYCYLSLCYSYLFIVSSPYERATYRYTPLLAVLLIPNHTIHPSFGKYLFALCDIVNGLLIYRLLKHALSQPYRDQKQSGQDKQDVSTKSATNPEERSALLAASHLLNPLVIGISTRGSSESVLSLWVLAALYNAFHEQWDIAAVFIGIGAHWKIYPAFYAISCLSIIGTTVSSGTTPAQGFRPWLRTVLNWRTLRFFLISAGTFFSLGIVCYLMYVIPHISSTERDSLFYADGATHSFMKAIYTICIVWTTVITFLHTFTSLT